MCAHAGLALESVLRTLMGSRLPGPQAQQLGVSVAAWVPGFQGASGQTMLCRTPGPPPGLLGLHRPSLQRRTRAAWGGPGLRRLGKTRRVWVETLSLGNSHHSLGWWPSVGKAGSAEGGHCPAGAELGECWSPSMGHGRLPSRLWGGLLEDALTSHRRGVDQVVHWSVPGGQWTPGLGSSLA